MENLGVLGVFIITYERSGFLMDTLHKVLAQTTTPSQVIIVDNSLSNSIIKLLNDNSKLKFDLIKMDGNIGPAGASKFALEKLTNDGFDWIYWGDDDDPPSDPKTFERLLEIAAAYPNAGIIGKVGGKFIPNRARTRVFANSELNPITEADYVTGGKQMIVSSKLINEGVLPNPDLFFGFEELDFCLRAKDAGFSILIDGSGIMEARNRNGNSNPNYRWKGKSYGRIDQLNRQYYSLRNLFYILSSRKEWIGYLFLLLKTVGKMILSFRYGITYGSKFCKSQSFAFLHERKKKMGQFVVFP